MVRTASERKRDVRRVVEGARVVAAERARLIPDLVRSTGLSPEGVELGFTRHLELDPSDAELESLVEAAGDATVVHVVLSSNVFVAPLRAIAVARAAAPRVVVRPSRREPFFARALVRACDDPAITCVETLAVESLEEGELHVYGRDETIAAIRAKCPPNVALRAHGAGLGIAIVGADAALDDAARALAADVVAFDQRGCASPRMVFVEGDEARGEAFAGALHRALGRLGEEVPRGELTADERADAARWLGTTTVAGTTWRGSDHAVAYARSPLLPPPGRHVHVCAALDATALRHAIEPWSRWIVVLGTDEPDRLGALAPAHARVTRLGAMQRPPLDGPIDWRARPNRPRARG